MRVVKMQRQGILSKHQFISYRTTTIQAERPVAARLGKRSQDPSAQPHDCVARLRSG
jgi:hypothetical protein